MHTRIIRYDRSLLKSVPIKGSARVAGTKGHRAMLPGAGSENDPAVRPRLIFGVKAISDLEAAHAEGGARRGA